MNTVYNKKTCSRCNTIFDCNSESIESCQCYSIHLSENTKNQLREQYQDCLCNNCLLEIQSESDLKSTEEKS